MCSMLVYPGLDGVVYSVNKKFRKRDDGRDATALESSHREVERGCWKAKRRRTQEEDGTSSYLFPENYTSNKRR